KTSLEALGHQHYPFEQLLDELELPREQNRFPVTPVMFNMLNFGNYRKALDGELNSSRAYIDMKTELELDAQEYEDELLLRVHYRTGLFRRETIEYLMDEFT